ncbi:MAG: 50S ribosomal protein L4 [Chloroflexota bacterium]|nr:50S ribosomal protein L4 [Chloroflexota bacterium]
MRASVRSSSGETVDQVELREDIFGLDPHIPVMHQALVRQQANARLATASTKTRGEVSGGGRKPWRQKGTGRARHGSIREPQWRGGGTVFGPRPERNYRKRMPRKMRRLALRSALSVKAVEGWIVVVDELRLPAPKTREMVALLDRLAVDSSALILLPERDEAIERSAHNLPQVKTLHANYLNIRDLFTYDYLIISLGALATIESFLG